MFQEASAGIFKSGKTVKKSLGKQLDILEKKNAVAAMKFSSVSGTQFLVYFSCTTFKWTCEKGGDGENSRELSREDGREMLRLQTVKKFTGRCVQTLEKMLGNDTLAAACAAAVVIAEPVSRASLYKQVIDSKDKILAGVKRSA